jgi:hypothetical protein
VTIAEVCDELEKALLRRERYRTHEQGSYNALYDNAVLIRALVALGDRLVADLRHYAKRPDLSKESVRDARRRVERFYALRARALSLTTEPPPA